MDTPVLAAKASGALARPFLTWHNALGIQCALRIAPETWLKKCVAGGIDRVYEVRCSAQRPGARPVPARRAASMQPGPQRKPS